ncbi:MAG: (deoxy)nucleoside triphosphate pyrophosphohydrolase [Firmicutes bacterium]|nr:(deoxy)nucleoside triphosphate pyrophosphohydrolase [Bacillota bacterium]
MKQVCAAIIVHNDKILITQRNPRKKLPLLWEFPGGKIEKKETPVDCVKREIHEELGIEIDVIRKFHINSHRYNFVHIQLISFLASWQNGIISLNEHEKYLWVKKEELMNYDFAPADIPIIEKLREVDLCHLIQN